MRLLIFVAALSALSPPAYGFAGLYGTVTSSATHQPLQGVTVEASSGCLPPLPACAIYQSVVTGPDGTYDIGGLSSGNASLTAHYLPGEANYAPNTQTFVLNDGDSLQLDVQLDLGATIQGTVRRASDDSALPSIPLTLLSGDDSYIVTRLTTAADGTFHVEQLPAAGYVLRTENAVPYQDQFYAARKLTPPSQGAQVFDVIQLIPGSTATADFSLVTGGQVEGVITDRFTGLPVANAPSVEFSIYDANDDSGTAWISQFIPTDASGHYVLGGLPDAPIRLGAYSLQPYYASTILGCTDPCADVAMGTVFTVLAGTSQTVNFSMFPGAAVTGTVTRRSDGQPLQGVAITAYLNSFIFGQLVFARTTTDATGHYALVGESSDQVYISASSANSGGVSYIDQVYQDQNCVNGNCTAVGDLTDTPIYATTSNIDFHLDAGGAISGRVVTGDTGAGTDAVMSLFDSTGTLTATLHASVDGYFATSGLQPGAYYLTAASGGIAYDCVAYPNLPCPGGNQILNPDAAPIVISGTNDVSGILITLPTETVFTNGFD